MKFKCVVEYDYPIDHKPPVKAIIMLHGDTVETDRIAPYVEGPHGEWIDTTGNNDFVCSVCNHKAQIGCIDFCGSCGSDNRKRGEAE